MEPIRSHDALFRFVFGEPEQMAELLQGCLPPSLVGAIRWQTLYRLPDTFVDRVLGTRRGDLFFAAELGEATVLLQVLTEHKAEVDRFTALQLTGYSVRLLEAWRQEHAGARQLPAVLTFVLYHGEVPWDAPTSVHELVEVRGVDVSVAAELGARQLRQPFYLLDLSRVDEGTMGALWDAAVTGLVLRFLQFLRGVPLVEALTTIERWRSLVVRVLKHPRGRDVLAALCSWYLGRDPEDPTTLRTVMNKIEDEDLPMRSMLDLVLEMGEERGREKAELRGMRELLRSQLQARFGPLPERGSELLAAADAATLQCWSLRVLTAQELAEVLAGGTS